MPFQKRLCAVIASLLISFFLVSCQGKTNQIEYIIGVSQANMREQWRLMLTKELQDEVANHANIRLVITDATQDVDKQIRDIDRLMRYGIDLLIVSPCDAKMLTPVVREVHEKIPVIVLDRVVEGYDYSLFIGPDNNLIGKQAGEAVIRIANSKKTNVLELGGGQDARASIERSEGFSDALSKYPEISIRRFTADSPMRDSAEDLLLLYGESLEDVNIIFAHSDDMALGAHRALKKLGYDDQIKIISIDGFAGKDGGLEMVSSGIIDETITIPTGGREAIQFAVNILNHVSGVPKQIILRSHSITKLNLENYIRQFGRSPKTVDNLITIGYAQVGNESAWRIANNNSIVQAANAAGINLTVIDANQSQERQIEAIRHFITQKVDVIALSPVVEIGWDEVLLEAKNAKIPVILSDRNIEVSDDDLFSTFIGGDFVEEGRRAMRWILENVPKTVHPIRILELQGTLGASPTQSRKYGFELILRDNPGYEITFSRTGDFTFEGGKTVVDLYLQQHEWDIDAIYAHNDDMALGAIEALERHGILPGKDVKIVSVDGTKKALDAIIDGKLNCTVECSPLLGPELMKAVIDKMSGKELPLRIITDERVFTAENAKLVYNDRMY